MGQAPKGQVSMSLLRGVGRKVGDAAAKTHTKGVPLVGKKFRYWAKNK